MANSTEGMNWKAGITSYQLKWIAIVTMVIDHMGAILYPTEMVFRYIGRISFPIFCFLLVEGYVDGSVFSYRLWLQGNPADIYILPAAALPVGKDWMRSGLESDLESEHTGIWRICHDSDRII